MTLRLNRRSDSGLVPHVPPRAQDWRMVLRSRAWRAPRPGFWARQTGQPWGVRSLDNPAPEPVSTALGVLIFSGLALGTLVVAVIFRLLGIWS